MTVLTSAYGTSGRKEARLAHVDAMLLQREAAVPAHLVRVEGRVGVGARVTPTLHLPWPPPLPLNLTPALPLTVRRASSVKPGAIWLGLGLELGLGVRVKG